MHLLRLSTLALALLARPCPPVLRAAQPADPGELLRAVNRSPSLDAAWKRLQAARARTDAAGRLANPEAEVMASRVNAPVSTENRDLWELTLRQPLPRRGERAADRERAQAVVALAEADYALTAGDLAADLAAALAEAEGADERARLLATQRDRIQAALRSLEARLATGVPARLSDRLSLQTRAANLQLATEQARRSADDARLAARGRLGLAPDAPLPTFAAPAPADIHPEDATTLALARARVAEANAMGRMARAGAKPMTSVGLRFEHERGGMGRQETVGLALSSEIPWRSGRYSRAEARAAEAERAAAQSEVAAARHRLTSALARAERAAQLAATARALAAQTVPRLEAEHLTLTQATGVNAGGAMAGESAVLHAVDVLDKSTETRLQIIETETAARLALAELWRHVPAQRLLQPLP